MTRRPSLLPPSESFGHRLRQVNRLIQRDLGARIATLGITLGQWYVLRTLWESDGLTQSELAQRTGIANPAMVVAVRSLLAMGLVTRRRPEEDLRKYVISLTAKGARLEEPALRAALATNSEALDGVSGQDRDTCMRVLQSALDNLLKVGIDADDAGDVDAMIEGE